MLDLSRRMFLMRGSIAVAAAGVASSMPLLSEFAASPGAGEATEATQAATEAAPAVADGSAALTQDLVAHVRDLSGEINLYIGDRQIVVKDPALARALFQATH